MLRFARRRKPKNSLNYPIFRVQELGEVRLPYNVWGNARFRQAVLPILAEGLYSIVCLKILG